MKVLVIGCGSIGSRHIRNLRAAGVDVQVQDSNPAAVDRIAQELGWTAPTHTETAPAIALGTPQFAPSDAVMICTPASTHAEVARSLWEGGYRGPLFVEKPLVTRLDDADVFTGWPHPVTMVGYNWRFHPDVAPVGALSLSRRLSLHFITHTNMSTWPGSQYADPLLECSHEIDIACAWLGGPLSVLGGERIGGGAWVQMEHPRGDSVIDINWNADKPSREIRAIVLDRQRFGTRLQLSIDVRPESASLADSYLSELQHFLAAVKDNDRTLCPFSDGLRAIRICQQSNPALA